MLLRCGSDSGCRVFLHFAAAADRTHSFVVGGYRDGVVDDLVEVGSQLNISRNLYLALFFGFFVVAPACEAIAFVGLCLNVDDGLVCSLVRTCYFSALCRVGFKGNCIFIRIELYFHVQILLTIEYISLIFRVRLVTQP